MASSYLMALGDYRFSLETAAYQELTRSTEYRWQSQDRLRHRPAQQYLGPGREEITLNGMIYPSFRGGLGQLDRMRQEAEKGTPLLLTVSEFQSSDVFSETALFVTARVSRNSLLRPWPSARSAYLNDSAGRVWGQWVITRVEETQSVFYADGSPRQVEFRLKLARYGEDKK